MYMYRHSIQHFIAYSTTLSHVIPFVFVCYWCGRCCRCCRHTALFPTVSLYETIRVKCSSNKCFQKNTMRTKDSTKDETSIFLAWRSNGIELTANFWHACLFDFFSLMFFIHWYFVYKTVSEPASGRVSHIYGHLNLKSRAHYILLKTFIRCVFYSHGFIWCAICGKWIGYGHNQQLYISYLKNYHAITHSDKEHRESMIGIECRLFNSH